jgi:selenocysteine lyase/cysteine desulfurase/radical SAM superfamily enzyme YgiQ (UPF0313 family)
MEKSQNRITSTMLHMPPELLGNHCHIAPEWESGTGQRLWFISAPYGGAVLRFGGEPTSLLYAIAPLVQEIKNGAVADLSIEDVALLRPGTVSDELYAEMEYRLSRQSLRAVCISNLTAGSGEAKRIARLIKSYDPEIVTIFGGPHEDDIATKTSQDPDFEDIVDFSVAGDGEYALLQLVRLIFESERRSVADIKAAALSKATEFLECDGKGGVYFRHRGQSHELPLSGRTPRLDDLPLMPREMLVESDTKTFSIFKRAGTNVKTAQIMTHRGCAWRCSFCSESASINTRSVKSVIDEIEAVKDFRARNRERDPRFDREDYGAIFFDDSTFTTRSPRRKEFLRELYAYLKTCGMEWGCQTRLDQIDAETLEQMKEAGCTYIFTGLESASDEMLRAMVKDEGRRHIERAFDAINKVGIRVGVSLIFGVADLRSGTTRETKQTISETLDFIERQTKEGNIVLVSPNIATYYPDTRMTETSGSLVDFHDPVPNRGYPWNRFEEGEGHHPRGVTSELAAFIIEESIKRFGEYLVDQDICSIEGYAEAYRTGEMDHDTRYYADLNHSSIARPLREARAAAQAIADFTDISEWDRRRRVEEARAAAASLMGLPAGQRENVVLTRNATEAAGLAFWLSGLGSKCGGANVLTTDAENMSVPRAFRLYMDHGNPTGRDPWSSYQDLGAKVPKDYLVRKRKTDALVKQVGVISDTSLTEEKILEAVTPQTDLVVFCHVIRDDGRVCDVKRLCSRIREVNPNAYILVDGAQALGALPRVAVTELGCDFYVAAPHKTLGSYPLGLLYMSDRAKANVRSLSWRAGEGNLDCVIMKGMFADSLGVRPTVQAEFSLPEVVSFSTAVKSLKSDGWLSGNDCARLDGARKKLKSAFLEGLRHLAPAQVTSPVDNRHSNFILTFRFPGRDNRTIVERLWREHLVFASYIARTDVIRVSFGVTTSIKDINFALHELREVLSRPDANEIAKRSGAPRGVALNTRRASV